MRQQPPELPEQAVGLYRLPLAEFTPARDALAKSLTAAGDKAAAAAVKGLRKPSLAAWAVNQVVWQAPDAWRALLEATASLRAAHETATTVTERRQSARAQREALHECEARAASALAAASHAISPALTMAVGGTLLALAYGAGTPGLLDRELQPPGFDVLLGLDLAPVPSEGSAPEMAAAAPEPPKARSATREAAESARRQAEEQARERRRAALAAAERRHADARRAQVESQAAVVASDERCRALEQQLDAERRAGEAARRQLAEAAAAEAAARAQLEELRRSGS